MKSILFLTTLFPYPLDNGGKIKTFNTIKALAENYEIDLLSFVNDVSDLDNVDKLGKSLNSVSVVHKKVIRGTSKKSFAIDYLKSLTSSNPYSINKYYSYKMVQYINERLGMKNYDYVYIDHLPMMIYSTLFKDKKILLDQHNVESLIFKRIISNSNNVFKKLLGYVEFLKLKEFEKKALRTAHHIFCLSEEDKLGLKKLLDIGLEKYSVLPIHIKLFKEYNRKNVVKNSKLKLLFLGSMSWYPNQDGIKWFMDNVWPLLDSKVFELFIVGSNPPPFIQNYGNDFENVIVTGYVDDVDVYIEKCDISIVPLFVGSGQRVKIIESFAKCIPVLSTTVGAEGLTYKEGKDILIADSPIEFKKTLEIYQINKKDLLNISNAAQKNYQNNYSTEHLANKLDKILENIY